MWKFRFFSTSSRLICIAPSGFSKGDHPATRWENSNIEQYFTFTSKLVGKSVYISLKDNNSYKLILNHLHTNVPCCTQQINLASKLLVIFTNFRDLESQPPPCCIDPKKCIPYLFRANIS